MPLLSVVVRRATWGAVFGAAICWGSAAFGGSADGGEGPPPRSERRQGSDVEAASDTQDSRGRARESSEPSGPKPDAPPLDAGEKRPVVDYDGRGDEPTTAGDVLIWVPRVVLSPLYFASEYVVRRPLGWLVTTAEKNHWPTLLLDFFTFGPERNAGIIPTGLIDFGFRPSGGLYVFWDEAFAKRNDMRLRFASGGKRWWKLSYIDRVHLTSRQRFEVGPELEIRPDWVFYGLGPESPKKHKARFGKNLVGGQARYRVQLWRTSSFESEIGVQDVRVDGSVSCCGNPSVDTRIAAGQLMAPPGLNSHYTIGYERVELDLDTRQPRTQRTKEAASDFVAPPGSGIRVSMRGRHASNLRPESRLGRATYQEWIEYGASLGGFVDLTGQQRVLGVTLVTELADPIGNGSRVPFTEQVTLGGDFVMRGGLQGRLVGRSAAVARLEYTWPIWVWLDGSAFYEVGNVFGEHLDGFDPRLLRNSFGWGMRTTGSRDHPFEALVAFLTETFKDGASVESVRFVLGTSRGF